MDDKERQELKQQLDDLKKQDEKQKEIAEKMKADILADEELTKYFMLPLFYGLIDHALYKDVGYRFYDNMIAEVTKDDATYDIYKKELAYDLSSYNYINKTLNIYTCMAYIEARTLVYLFITSLYDISLIQDEKTKRQKLTQLKMYINDTTKERVYTGIADLLERAILHQKTLLAGQPVKIKEDIIAFEDEIELKLLDYDNNLEIEKTEQNTPISYLKSNVFVAGYLYNMTQIYRKFVLYLLGDDKADFKSFVTFTLEKLDSRHFDTNIYTDYGDIDSYEKRKQTTYDKYTAYVDALIKSDKPITYDDFIKLVAFDDAEREILTREKETDELAGLEKLTKAVETPNSYTFITNRLQNELHTLTKDFTGLTISKKETKGTKKAVVIDAKITYDEELDDALKQAGITEPQKQILNILHVLFKNAEAQDTPITLFDIYRFYAGGDAKRPQKSVLNEIKQNIEVLGKTRLTTQYANGNKFKLKNGEQLEILRIFRTTFSL